VEITLSRRAFPRKIWRVWVFSPGNQQLPGQLVGRTAVKGEVEISREQVEVERVQVCCPTASDLFATSCPLGLHVLGLEGPEQWDYLLVREAREIVSLKWMAKSAPSCSE
jgi:hypothetical protein